MIPDKIILVVGDAMVDQTITGEVLRVSPEAPVPVLKSVATSQVLGGAANVANNIAALGGIAELITIAGDDGEADTLRECIRAAPFEFSSKLIVEIGRKTTVKTRFIAQGQQLMRLDVETTDQLLPESEELLISQIEKSANSARLIVLSDYSKGVLNNRVIRSALRTASAEKIPVIVDPKRRDMSIYNGADYIKPNTSELSWATGLPCSTRRETEEAARILIDQTNATIFVTHGANGMSLHRSGQKTLWYKSRPQAVFDATGAGDTSLAAFAVGLVNGLVVEDIVKFANLAAGISVTKPGTSVVSAREITTELEATTDDSAGRKLVDTHTLVALCQSWRDSFLKIGFTNGCFDILHAGHISLLNTASKGCDRLIVGLNSDSSVRALKGSKRPVQDQVSRAMLLSALECVDAVVIFNETTPINLISKIRPDILIKGADYKIEKIVGYEIVSGYGGEIKIVDLVEGKSTSNILKKIFPESV